MKKTGILNPELMHALTSLGHTDRFIICDAGFPIPHHIKRIDLTLTAGIPSFMDCIKGVLSEIIVEEIALSKEMREVNPETHDAVCKLFQNQKRVYLDQSDLLKETQNVSFIIRSAEFAPYSNILLTSASGVEKYYRGFEILRT